MHGNGSGFFDTNIQMAYEFGMNPKNSEDQQNHKQEPWELPLSDFIVEFYSKRFRKNRPEAVKSIERIVAERKWKREEWKLIHKI